MERKINMKNQIKFPDLEISSRDREFKKVSTHLRDKVLYLYLFDGYSHRRLDSEVLKVNEEYSRGYLSMGVLHHMGIVDKHKAIFREFDFKDALVCLKDKFESIRKSLLRYKENMYLEDDLDCFYIDDVGVFLHKNIGLSQFKEGVRINKKYHEIFNPSNSEYHIKRGETRKIKILFNNKVFDAKYCYENQDDKTVCLHRISFFKPLKEEFKKVYPSECGEFLIYMGRDVNHFVFKNVPYIVDIEDIDNCGEDEYDEGRKLLKAHLIRERNPSVIKRAKEIFKKNNGRLFCEVCGFNFQAVYGERGEDYIEGHHKIWLSDVSEQRKTNVYDIAMLCANCHRMIHRTPRISLEEMKKSLKVAVN